MKPKRITVFVFFKPDEIIKNSFYSTSATKTTEFEALFCNWIREKNTI